MTLSALFDTPMALPVVPKVIQQLILSFQDDNISIDQIADQLATDPVLSAKTLRLANSACFHVSRRIATVDEALQLLGFVMVRNLVLGFGTSHAFKGVSGMDLPRFWRHSLHTAVAARWLARQAEENGDLAFTVALVHGVGQLVMHTAIPGPMRSLDRECDPLASERAAAEVERLGYHHGAVSAELAKRWNFPVEVSEPLRHWPDPLAAETPNRMAVLIHIAAWRARVEAFGWDADQAQASCPVNVGRAIGLAIAWLPEDNTLGVGLLRPTPMPPMDELTEGLESMFE